jgi:hypothetical protein
MALTTYFALSGIYGCYRGFTTPIFDNNQKIQRILFSVMTGIKYTFPPTNIIQVGKLGGRLYYRAKHYKNPDLLKTHYPYFPFDKIDLYSEWRFYNAKLF